MSDLTDSQTMRAAVKQYSHIFTYKINERIRSDSTFIVNTLLSKVNVNLIQGHVCV